LHPGTRMTPLRTAQAATSNRDQVCNEDQVEVMRRVSRELWDVAVAHHLNGRLDGLQLQKCWELLSVFVGM